MRFHSLLELVRALRSSVISDQTAARQEIRRLCSTSFRALADRVLARVQPDCTADRLADVMLGWLRVHLLSRSESELHALTAPQSTAAKTNPAPPWDKLLVAYSNWVAARHFLWGPLELLSSRQAKLKKALSGASKTETDSAALTPADLRADGWRVRVSAMPLDQVSGDAVAGQAVGANLWLFLADATGHGWLAYFLVRGVTRLWHALLERMPRASPKELCQALDEQLAACLPPGMYVEGLVARGDGQGEFRASPAGACNVLTRRAGGVVELQSWGDLWLGLAAAPREEQSLKLGVGDELLWASDGLYEHPDATGPLGAALAARLTRDHACRTLHEGALALLAAAQAAGNAPADDVTLVSLIRPPPDPCASAEQDTRRPLAMNSRQDVVHQLVSLAGDGSAAGDAGARVESDAAPSDSPGSAGSGETGAPAVGAAPAGWSDEDLVALCVGGSETARGELARRYDGLVRAVVRRGLQGSLRDEWEDALQEAWVKILRGLEKWRGSAPLGSYLATIAARAAVDIARHFGRLPRARGESSADGKSAPSPEPAIGGVDALPGQLIHAENVLRLRAAAAKLPPKLREHLRLRMEGHDTAAIAALSKRKDRAIQLQYQKIIRLLQAMLDGEQGSG